jgi:hypothetical protein
MLQLMVFCIQPSNGKLHSGPEVTPANFFTDFSTKEVAVNNAAHKKCMGRLLTSCQPSNSRATAVLSHRASQPLKETV